MIAGSLKHYDAKKNDENAPRVGSVIQAIYAVARDVIGANFDDFQFKIDQIRADVPQNYEPIRENEQIFFPSDKL